MKKLAVHIFGILFIGFLFIQCSNSPKIQPSEKILFNNNWEFFIPDDTSFIANPDILWENIKLPHTPLIEPLVVNDQWQGICWYRKSFVVDEIKQGKQFFMKFDGAMNVAEVWVNGIKKIKHLGGYLPFVIDFTNEVKFGEDNEVLVKLDNRDNPITGPKPLDILDFNMYGGLYRGVHLIIKNPLFISDPIFEGKEAGGGVFVRYSTVTKEEAILQVKTHIRNVAEENVNYSIFHELWKNNTKVAETHAKDLSLKSKGNMHNTIMISVNNPELWSPENPNLYSLVTKIISNNELLDIDTTQIGIRKFEFIDGKLSINGNENFLRGVNRHQEYPYIGYALSNEAQYRAAIKIKEAGFDYVRLSHYPHSPAFMDACDEIGLVVIDAILGWQYFSEDPNFQSHIYQTAHDLIRRDRNHPCVLAWEVSLNESWMPESFIDSLIHIAHNEYPGDQCFTAGWQKYGYDIYLQARQHRINHYEEPDKPYVVSEYGDWEYYAMNAGLDQDEWQDLKQEERSSRQLLSFGEERLLQQATNIQEAHNDNLNTPAFADGYWVMFDYNRGYSDDLEASGIMSINRLPKFSYYFFQSQRGPDEVSELYQSGPMVYIASYWNETSSLDIRIFSNCEEVELYLNDSLIGKQKPDNNRISSNLTHPPFTFKLNNFEKGELKALGMIKNNKVADHTIITPEEPVKIRLRLDESGKPAEVGVNDVIFVYAEIIDRNGTVVPVNDLEVQFSLEGNAELISPTYIKIEAGIASALLRIGDKSGLIRITASAGKDLLLDDMSFYNN